MIKLINIIKVWYKNKYSLNYIIDAITGRQIKYRVGKCDFCGFCCRFINDLSFCKFFDIKTKKCLIYNQRVCNTEFPVNQEELDHFFKIFPDFRCNYYFEKDK